MHALVWHNPRCSKSRQALTLLRDRGIETETRDYQRHPPTPDEIRAVLEKLGLGARDILRQREPAYEIQELDGVEDEERLVRAMADHPELIERPIVIVGDRAVLARSPEALLGLLG